MIFQLIIRDVEWYQYLINFLIVLLGRLLDVLSTRYVTKELKLETNKLARRVGWRGMVLLQIPIVILGTIEFYFAFFIFVWSLFLFANNIQGAWYIREVGEDKYQEELQNRVKNSKTWKIILGELSNLITFTLAGIFIIIFVFILHDLLAVLFICLAVIFQGLLGTFRSLKYLFELKREDSNGIDK